MNLRFSLTKHTRPKGDIAGRPRLLIAGVWNQETLESSKRFLEIIEEHFGGFKGSPKVAPFREQATCICLRIFGFFLSLLVLKGNL